jgi:uncharacterized protein
MADPGALVVPWCTGDLLVGGEAAGELVKLAEPLSFWGGVDEETGIIIDRHHPQVGTTLAGTALLMGATRGSSSSTSTLLECIRRGTAPALLLLTEPDPILVIGAVVAWEIYGRGPSVVLLSSVLDVKQGLLVRVRRDGGIDIDNEPKGIAP